MKPQSLVICDEKGCVGVQKISAVAVVKGVVSELVCCSDCGRVYRKKDNWVREPLKTKNGERIFYSATLKTIQHRA